MTAAYRGDVRASTSPPKERYAVTCQSAYNLEIRAETIEIALGPLRLLEAIRGNQSHGRQDLSDEVSATVLTVPARVKRTSIANTLMIEGQREASARPDRSLLRLIAQARLFSDLVTNCNGRSIKDLASDVGVGPSYLTRVIRLSVLAPDITEAIAQGRQPAEFSAIKLLRAGQFSPRWPDQRREIGLD